MLIGFNLIFYNLLFRKVDATIATEKVRAGADLRFACFDRLEIEADYSYQHFSLVKDRQRRNEARRLVESLSFPVIVSSEIAVLTDSQSEN